MRILFATDVYLPTPGGISVVTNRLAHMLAQKGHEVCIIAPSTSWKSQVQKEGKVKVYRIPAFLIHKLKQIRISPAGFYKKRIEKIIHSCNPDIVHMETASTIASTVAEIAKKQGIAVIGTCHIMPENAYGFLPFLPKQLEKSIGNLYVKQIVQTFNTYADFVTAPTETGISILEANGITVEHKAMSNGINLSVFVRPEKSVQESVKEKFKLPDTPLILYVGRLDKEKSVDVLIKSLAFIPKTVSFYTVIAGKGEGLRMLSQLAKSKGVADKITFTGFVSDEDLYSLYALASIFVMPSTAELQSLVTMEAMAIGMPVVGANAGALPYLIKNGENGYLFKPGDEKDLATKFKDILTHPSIAHEMAAKGKKLVAVHDINKVIANMEKLYLYVIKKSASLPKQAESNNLLQSVSSFLTAEKV